MEPHTSAHGRLLSPRRVATEPLPLQPPRRSLSVSSASSSRSTVPSGSSLKTLDESIETLFDHPSVKIIAFTSSQRSSSFGAPDFFAEPKPGSLPASSKLERTLAVGMLCPVAPETLSPRAPPPPPRRCGQNSIR